MITREKAILITPGNRSETMEYLYHFFLEIARKAIEDRGAFYVALSGGSTPLELYRRLAATGADKLDWSCVYLFWSDERAAPPTDPENNYFMTMESGFLSLPIPPSQIHRMQAEKEMQKEAANYEKLITEIVPDQSFDLILLGIGEDGHTASLFPGTAACLEEKSLVVSNFVPQKKSWRMTFTFRCINQAKEILMLATGPSKAEILEKCLNNPPDLFPVQRVGSTHKKAHWVLDNAAAALLG